MLLLIELHSIGDSIQGRGTNEPLGRILDFLLPLSLSLSRWCRVISVCYLCSVISDSCLGALNAIVAPVRTLGTRFSALILCLCARTQKQDLIMINTLCDSSHRPTFYLLPRPTAFPLELWLWLRVASVLDAKRFRRGNPAGKWMLSKQFSRDSQAVSVAGWQNRSIDVQSA